ncbi:hypothetical protein CC1G_01482 [Coprinopsis cinerea okayama7|uniref:Uncharacterized protein n=1 Tax=Coprinopsis cinerea (strain Okayama-7 / 130 / ATCC MYA-4618 / FGSC 9003) TaxID=240176 RepID=A8NHQ7_COPC7|nr:hypothetical protein CC1G_01482 [Coprinopsis cinerea okayama7\|eukprot:XP_001833805.1 hypothetical protein CC1G_01482 [Coprinopsis cinerea okayama7\
MRVGVFFTSLLVLLPTILASPTHLYRRDYSGESGSSGSGSGSEVGNSSGSGSNVAYNVGGVYGGGSGGYNYDGGAGDGGGYGGTNVEDGEGDGGDNEGQRGSGSGGGYDYDEGGNDDEGSAGGAGEDDGDNGGDDGGDNGEDGNGNDEGSSGDDDSSSEYDVEDVRILSYALSYEYLATAFYEDSFSRWSCQDFENFGIDEWAYKRYEQIYKHRKAYVKFLESAIEASGAELIPPCTYNFDYSNDVNDFVNLSQYFELAGTSLYNGVLGYIHNKTPLSFNQIWTIGHPFYSSCPSSGPGMNAFPAGLRDYPSFKICNEDIIPGENVGIDLSEAYGANPSAFNGDQELFAVFALGTGSYVQPLYAKGSDDGGNGNDKDFWMKVPKELESTGAVYVSIVQASPDEASQSGFQIDDQNTVAGPKIWMFNYDSDWKPEKGYELFQD